VRQVHSGYMRGSHCHDMHMYGSLDKVAAGFLQGV
jgi:hypothetical protein